MSCLLSNPDLNIEGYIHLSTNIIFKDAELKADIIPKSLEPIEIKYPTYMKILKYTKKDNGLYDLIEDIYRQDLSDEIERRKSMINFSKIGDVHKIHIVRVEPIISHMADAQTQIEKVETSVMTTMCRFCGGGHFSSNCQNQTTERTQKKYNLMDDGKSSVNLNMISDFCYSIRVINIPRNCTEDDWKKVVQSTQENCPFRIKMIGMRRGEFNGTCIVSYKTKSEAEQGLKLFHKMTYGTSILDCYYADDQRR